MPAPTPPPMPDAPPAVEGAVLLPSEAFFVRRVPLDPAADAATQVELALETSAPFAVGQLFYGYLRAEDGASALVFATHRRLFDADSWDGATAVLPEFLVLLDAAPKSALVRVWRSHLGAVAMAWDGAALPAVVVARKFSDETSEEADTNAVRDEALRRLGRSAQTEEFFGNVQTEIEKDELVLRLGKLAARFGAADRETIDVRDKAVLAERRERLRRDRLLWRVLAASLGVLVLAGVLELAMLGTRAWLSRAQAAQRQVAVEVEKIQTAQTLGTRIEEMSQRRLRAFEMLAVINQVRPPGLMFTRAVTNGRDVLEVEGQSANSDNVGAYESALRALPQLSGVEFPDVRLREGVTTFQFSVRFKDGSLTSVTGTQPAPAPAPGGVQ